MLCIVSWKKNGIEISQEEIEKVKKRHNIPLQPPVDMDQYSFLLQEKFLSPNHACVIAPMTHYIINEEKVVDAWKLFAFDMQNVLVSKGIHNMRVFIRHGCDMDCPAKTREWHFGKEET